MGDFGRDDSADEWRGRAGVKWEEGRLLVWWYSGYITKYHARSLVTSSYPETATANS